MPDRPPQDDESVSEQTPTTGAPGPAPGSSTLTAVPGREQSESTSPQSDPAQETATRYTLHEEHGRGGLGRVLRAHDHSLDRVVAVKQLLRRSKRAERRFLREAMITARLQHPAIVPVHEVGVWSDGSPYYAMKLVEGRPLKELLEDGKSLGERLDLLPHVIAVADAMAYAHANKIIHRDLKPSNVIVGEFGETIVIDWGLAKDLLTHTKESETGFPYRAAPGTPERTSLGTVLGTPAYMPPEQAAGRRVDERADVYAIGALLYCLAAGHPPYIAAEPGTIIERVLSQGPTPIRDLQPELSPDLAAIIGKAMQRDPSARYRTAKELADDLHRYQRGQLVSAHVYDWRQLLSRWVARHRALVALGTAAVLLLIAVSTVGLVRILRERDAANDARETAEARANRLVLMQAASDLNVDPTRTLVHLRDHPLETSGERLEAQWLAARALARGVSPIVTRGHEREPWTSARASRAGRFLVAGRTEFTVWDVSAAVPRYRLHPDSATTSLWVGDDGGVVTAHESGELRVWNSDGAPTARWPSGTDIAGLREVPGTSRLAFVDYSGGVWLFDRATGLVEKLHTLDAPAMGVLATLDGRHVISAATSGRVVVLNLDGTVVRTWQVEACRAYSFYATRGGDMAAVACDDGAVYVCGATAEKCARRKTPVDAPYLQFSHDGSLLFGCDRAGQIHRFDLVGNEESVVARDMGRLRYCFLDPSGRYLAAGSGDGIVVVLDVQTSDTRRLGGPEGEIQSFGWVGDTGQIYATAADGTLRTWQAPVFPRKLARGYRSGAAWVGFAPRADLLVARSWASEATTWFLDGASAPQALVADSPFSLVRPAPDGRLVASAHEDQTIRLLDTLTGSSRELAHQPGLAAELVFSQDGGLIAASAGGGPISVWDLRQDRKRSSITVHKTAAFHLQFSAGGDLLYSADVNGVVAATDISTGNSSTLAEIPNGVDSLAVAEEFGFVVAGSRAGVVWFIPIAGGEARAVGRLQGTVFDLDVSPRLGIAIALSGSGSIGAWSLRDGTPVTLPPVPRASRLAFDPSATSVAVVTSDGDLAVYDFETEELQVQAAHRGHIWFLAWEPKGNGIATAGEDGVVRVWNRSSIQAVPGSTPDLRNFLTAATSYQLSSPWRDRTGYATAR